MVFLSAKCKTIQDDKEIDRIKRLEKYMGKKDCLDIEDLLCITLLLRQSQLNLFLNWLTYYSFLNLRIMYKWQKN